MKLYASIASPYVARVPLRPRCAPTRAASARASSAASSSTAMCDAHTSTRGTHLARTARAAVAVAYAIASFLMLSRRCTGAASAMRRVDDDGVGGGVRVHVATSEGGGGSDERRARLRVVATHHGAPA